MSKKNKLSTRRNQHQFNIDREKKLEKERQEKKEKRKEKKERSLKLKGAVVKRKNKRGIRLKKNAVVKGVKIKNAASKAKARRLILAAMKDKMDMD